MTSNPYANMFRTRPGTGCRVTLFHGRGMHGGQRCNETPTMTSPRVLCAKHEADRVRLLRSARKSPEHHEP